MARNNYAAKTICLYLLAFVSWVAASDWLFPRIWSSLYPIISPLKNWAFVLVTSPLLYLLLQRESARRDGIENELRAQAIYDPLTGLLNRPFFNENLERAVAQAARDGERVGVVFLDLDGFKTVNDTFGHHVGDDLLMEAGRRIKTVVRSADCAARFGGDEFVVLVHRDRDGATGRLAARLTEALRKPFLLRAADIALTASAGFALYPSHGSEAGQIIRAADKAMYQVKEMGKNAILEAASLRPQALYSGETSR